LLKPSFGVLLLLMAYCVRASICGLCTVLGGVAMACAPSSSPEPVGSSQLAIQNLGPASCVLSQGYWKNHPNSWPVTSLTLGGVTYTEADLINLLDTPTGGDASLVLGHQLIAGLLNVANGAQASGLDSVIAQSQSWMAANRGSHSALPYGVSASSTAGQQATSLSTVLDQYNNGQLPATCGVAPAGYAGGGVGEAGGPVARDAGADDASSSPAPDAGSAEAAADASSGENDASASPPQPPEVGPDGSAAAADAGASCQQVRLGAGVIVHDASGAPMAVDPDHTRVIVETRSGGGTWEPAPDVTVEWGVPPPLDVSIVADNSGSEQGHLAIEQTSIMAFADRVYKDAASNRVGLVRVSTGANIYEPLTTDGASFDTAVDTLFIHDGWTALWKGARLANDVLAGAPPRVPTSCFPGAYRSVVLFTDGQDNNSSAQKSTYDDDGINTTFQDVLTLHVGPMPTAIYTIGVGNQVDETQLQTLATSTGGQYAKIADWSKLEDAMLGAAAQLEGLFPVCFVPTCGAVDARITVVRISDGATLGTQIIALP
jgi:hypothetical protein